MTTLSQIILDKYQVRKSRKQKTAFINLMEEHFPDIQIQEGGFPKSRNLILGDVEKAEVILTAHYDTCAWLPFPNFITPKNPLIYILYSILIIVPIFVPVLLLSVLMRTFISDPMLHYWICIAAYLLLFYLLLAGPANKHTANDNTSGVITLCEIYQQLSDEERAKVAFVFFDNEEQGMMGSAFFKSQYKKLMKEKLLMNFDCVSDGDTILVAVSKTARKKYAEAIEKAYCGRDNKVFLIDKAEKTLYPSDQANFKCTAAFAALKHKKFIGYYMDRIHTHKDTIFDENNIQLLTEQTQQFIKYL